MCSLSQYDISGHHSFCNCHHHHQNNFLGNHKKNLHVINGNHSVQKLPGNQYPINDEITF